MTTTELYSGISSKNSSRVLRPPGGGSSNIFGGSEEPAERPQQQRQQQQAAAGQSQAAAPSQPQAPPQQQDQQGQKANKNRGDMGPAPFASFAESGKKSIPTQFDDCNTESQNDADFRCYSVTAYRESMATNAAVRQKARGSATGAVNPITHEENGQAPPNPFQTYEQGRTHPQQVQSQQVPMERGHGRKGGQNAQQRRGKFNPITGEDYPESYGQNEDGDQKPEGEGTDKTEEQDQPADTTETKTEDEPPKASASTPAATKPADSSSYLVKKVRQPPGGASSGLW